MKGFWICASILFVIFSCDNTLDLNADWKDIPVVYGLLSASDQSQYIRIEKAFLDPATPAPDVALISDSIYYSNLEVSLLNTDNNELYSLTEIDGAADGFPRGQGAFASMPNILYKIASSELNISPGQNLELQINRGEGTSLVRATTKVIDTVLISQPSSRINFSYTSNFRIQWFPKSTGNEPSVYDVGLIFRYDEEIADVPDSPVEEKSIYWLIAKNVDETEILKSGKEFYIFLDNNLEANSNIRRTFRSIEVVVDAGGEEILNYARVGQANLGITASQEIPFYTNISEGRGIFSSRNRKIKPGILLTEVAKDSLVNGTFTKDLNFKR